MGRVDKENYYLNIAEAVLERSTCIRRKYGAVIVKNDEIVSTGYNGAARGCGNCVDMNECLREKLGVPPGERYELCRSVHAEANAIIAAPREQMLGATMYLVCHDRNGLAPAESCRMCRRLMINAGIQRVINRTSPGKYSVIPVRDWVAEER
ncbi:MAG: cytidine deaminase [Oscillospiraceae bacterium]|jgi:dCMP deaminase|nr:cytidine deaminase [Oscillospiraceae bacterium]